MKLLDTYLSREIAFPFLVGLAGFFLIEIGTLLFNGLIQRILDAGVPPGFVLLMLLYKVPTFIVQGLPIATLFGVSLGINRMAREGEINAMRISGVPLRRMLLPLIAVGLAISGIDYLINEKIAPPANTRFNLAVEQLWMQAQIPKIQADTFFHAGNYTFYVGTVEKKSNSRFIARNVMIYQLRMQRYPLLITAESAETDGSNWTLYNCRYIDIQKKERLGDFPRYVLPLKLDVGRYLSPMRGAEEMSTEELGKQIQQFIRIGGKPDKNLVMEYHQKYSVPLGCLVVVLVSLPLAVHFSRSGSFIGVLLSIVLNFFYMNTFFLARILGQHGLIPPVLAAWAHNIIFALIGLVMLWREE